MPNKGGLQRTHARPHGESARPCRRGTPDASRRNNPASASAPIRGWGSAPPSAGACRAPFPEPSRSSARPVARAASAAAAAASAAAIRASPVRPNTRDTAPAHSAASAATMPRHARHAHDARPRDTGSRDPRMRRMTSSGTSVKAAASQSSSPSSPSLPLSPPPPPPPPPAPAPPPPPARCRRLSRCAARPARRASPASWLRRCCGSTRRAASTASACAWRTAWRLRGGEGGGAYAAGTFAVGAFARAALRRPGGGGPLWAAPHACRTRFSAAALDAIKRQQPGSPIPHGKTYGPPDAPVRQPRRREQVLKHGALQPLVRAAVLELDHKPQLLQRAHPQVPAGRGRRAASRGVHARARGAGVRRARPACCAAAARTCLRALG
jgi:hypothetical protein